MAQECRAEGKSARLQVAAAYGELAGRVATGRAHRAGAPRARSAGRRSAVRALHPDRKVLVVSVGGSGSGGARRVRDRATAPITLGLAGQMHLAVADQDAASCAVSPAVSIVKGLGRKRGENPARAPNQVLPYE